MILYCSNIEYEMQANKWCMAYKCLEITLPEAKIMCSDDPDCSTFYDFKNKHYKFCFCNEDANIEDSTSGSYLYIKGDLYYFVNIFIYIIEKKALLNLNYACILMPLF